MNINEYEIEFLKYKYREYEKRHKDMKKTENQKNKNDKVDEISEKIIITNPKKTINDINEKHMNIV
jgi:hypothetical protein